MVRLKEILDGNGVEIEDFVSGKMSQNKSDSIDAGPMVPSPDPKVQTPDPKVQTPDPKVQTPDPKVPISDPKVLLPDPKVPSPNPKVPIPDPTQDRDNLSRGSRSGVTG